MIVVHNWFIFGTGFQYWAEEWGLSNSLAMMLSFILDSNETWIGISWLCELAKDAAGDLLFHMHNQYSDNDNGLDLIVF